jgi:hypothetical protein
MTSPTDPGKDKVEAVATWRPIETAPKDGTDVLICWADIPQMAVARWDQAYSEMDFAEGVGWRDCSDYGCGGMIGAMPTHWMPLPALPSAAITAMGRSGVKGGRGMTVSEIRAEVERIRSIARDDEAAHSAEDGLRERVLRFIADGKADDPQHLALAALETSKIDFQRWCA